MSHPADSSPQDALLTALRVLLRPLARLAVARGVSYGAFDELVRVELVRAARESTGVADGHGQVSRVAMATGLTRREVGRLVQQDEPHPESMRSPAGEVFTRWLGDPAWRDAEGPRALPRAGERSFEALAQSVTRDVHPRSLLDELCRLELADWDQKADIVRLKREAFVPRGDLVRLFGFLGENAGDHLSAAVANVLGTGSEHFEQAVFADELSAESVAALRPLIAEQWKILFDRLVPALEARIAADRAAGRPQDQRVRVGLYSYAAPMAGDVLPVADHAPARLPARAPRRPKGSGTPKTGPASEGAAPRRGRPSKRSRPE